MTALRDLIVSIDFDDIDIAALTNVDTAMDAIQDQLGNMGGQLQDATSEFDAMGNDATNALNNIINNVDDATGALDNLGGQADQTGDQSTGAMDDLTGGAADATNQVEDLTNQMNGTNNATKSLGSSIKKLIGIVVAFVAVDKIKDMANDMIQLAAEAKATSAQFEQVFDGFEGQAEKALQGVGDETHILTGRLKGSFLGIAAFAKTTGMDTENALKLTTRATLAAADGAAFYDKSIEEVSESLQSFLKGNFANDAALGISATETTRNATANKLYGKTFKKLSEEQKQLTLLQMVEDGNKLSGALGQAAREGDGFENVMGNMKQSWKELKATWGDRLLGPAVESLQGITAALLNFDPDPVINFLNKVVDFGGKAWGVLMQVKESVMSLVYDTGEVSDIWVGMGVPREIADDIATIGDVLRVAVIKGAELAKKGFEGLKAGLKWSVDNYDKLKLGAIGLVGALVAFKVITGIKSAFTAFNATLTAFKAAAGLAKFATLGFNTALLANPITWIAIGIGLLIAGVIYLVKNFDWARDAFDKTWSFLKESFSAVMDWMMPYVTNAMDVVTDAFGTVKDFIVEIMPMIITIIKDSWSTMVPIFKFYGTLIWETVKFAFTTIWNVISLAFTNIKNIISVAWTVISGVFKTALQLVTGDFSGAWETMKDTAFKAIEGLIKFFEDFILGAKKIGSDFVQGIIDGFLAVWDSLKETAGKIWDSITNIFDKKKTVDVGVNVDSRGAQPLGIDGSHALGLASVPFDNYTANLHKDEAVLTAYQSNALREAGILSNRGSKPVVQMNQGGSPRGGGGYGTFAPQVIVQVNGAGANEQRIAQLAAAASRKELEKFWRQMVAAQG